ncbi:hypothetical protein KR093_002036 [Drosophila rubida]|uniref:Uncharacterized protein n=1 Tax=Drosophila rubida TaxID=30044 RepID=A0AAD4K3J0_9MUSC|nr:hypothetical protein KR093_002036 [Drosophila rubida]
MGKVCTHCRDLFAEEATNTWAAWWHDDTPAFYKDVSEMTVYDCNKLKHLLELEVAALHPNKAIPSKSFHFKLWQKVLLICIYVGIIVAIILICRYWKLGRREKDRPVDEEKEESNRSKVSKKEPTPLPEDEPPRVEKRRRTSLKGWMRYRCRPVFLHNEASLRRQQAKYREKELLREAYTRQNIEKWTKAREKVEKKRRERESVQETNANENRQAKA